MKPEMFTFVFRTDLSALEDRIMLGLFYAHLKKKITNRSAFVKENLCLRSSFLKVVAELKPGTARAGAQP